MKRFSFSIVICAYTNERWDDLFAAVQSLWQQTLTPHEVIVVIDHNPELFTKVRLNLPGVLVIENQEQRGLSGARNSGIMAAQGDVVAFLDDDAFASESWLEHLEQGYQDPTVCGVGGSIHPIWTQCRPRWFPEEFDWTVGCTYRGMPEIPTTVRNLIGANMSYRRDLLLQMGGFQTEIGQVGSGMHRCDDTEFCIRVSQQQPQLVFYYEPRAIVYHRVPIARAQWRYFQVRCFTEGQTKARLSSMLGTKHSLASERVYTWYVLPKGFFRALGDVFYNADMSGLGRAGAIGAGLALTSLGYLSSWINQKSKNMHASHTKGSYTT